MKFLSCFGRQKRPPDDAEAAPLDGAYARGCVFCDVSAERGFNVAYEVGWGAAAALTPRQDDELIVFHDRAPAAREHLLVVPRRHVSTVRDLRAGDTALGGLLLVGRELTSSRAHVCPRARAPFRPRRAHGLPHPAVQQRPPHPPARARAPALVEGPAQVPRRAGHGRRQGLVVVRHPRPGHQYPRGQPHGRSRTRCGQKELERAERAGRGAQRGLGRDARHHATPPTHRRLNIPETPGHTTQYNYIHACQ
ncbi:hypothetical protein VHUM_04029 [Vanrija humicola]|uniref:HIT domain-containing protein n=1 Tax=Vanrija humicola TaxID=5417 RepID=A0A7D8Z2W5_VANHU|nr:hypothetical protein VHUM_04029 [Vanrija humicola]